MLTLLSYIGLLVGGILTAAALYLALVKIQLI